MALAVGRSPRPSSGGVRAAKLLFLRLLQKSPAAMTAPQWGTSGATTTSAATSRPTVESSPPMFVPTVIVSTAPAHGRPTLIAPDSGSSAASPEFLFALDEAALQRIRRTAETPPRVSILDVIGAITGQARNNCAAVWSRLRESRPDVAARCGFFKFPGRRQRKTPVAGAGAILDIVMILPGQAAVALRQQTAGLTSSAANSD